MKVSPPCVTAVLAAFFVFSAFVVNGLLGALSPAGYNETGLHQSFDMLQARSGDDSWGPMAIALEYLAEPGEKPLYSAVFFDGEVKFQYPPSALFGLLGLEALWPGHVRTADGMSFGGWPSINDLVGWIFVAISAIASAAIFEFKLQQMHGDQDWHRLRWLRCVLIAALTITFYPIAKAFTLGQIQVWINGIFALAVLFWIIRRPALCGGLLGLICLMKPHYGLLFVWASLQREWRFVGAGMVIGAIGGLASIAVFGLSNHIDYLRVLSFISERGEAYYANQSVNGLLNRLMSLWSPDLYTVSEFGGSQFPPYNPWVYWPSLITSLIILILVLRPGREPDRSDGFASAAASVTIASPIAWEHHYGIFLPLFMLMFPIALGDRKRLVWLAVSYVLIATQISAVRLLAPSVLNVFQSYTLAGALIFLLQLHLRLPGWASGRRMTSAKPFGRSP